MNVVSWIFVVVFGVAFVATITSFICKYIYTKKTRALMEKACNFTEEERETYKKMLQENSKDLRVNIFDLFDEE